MALPAGIPGRIDPAFAPGEATQKASRLFEIKYTIQTAIETCNQAKEFTRNKKLASLKTIVKELDDYVAALR